ncbi:MAG: anti-phage defense protein ZorA [Rhodospirillaceae bacterium]|nr:anti-phage defense protein ZorA [Rhodospirillaceae bacterium]
MEFLKLPSWPEILSGLRSIEEALKPLFSAFEGPELAIGISLVMIALAAIVFLWMIWRMKPMTSRLGQLTRLIDRNNQSRQDFQSSYSRIDEAMGQTKFVRHGWSEFTETLVFPRDASEPIRNSARPQFYINIQAAEAAGKTLRLLQAIPNYFVGFGLLFTFLGLVAAIFFASQGIDAGSVEDAQKSLKKLLSAATFKFSTSIVGLGASIVLSLTYRILAQGLQRNFERLGEAIEKGLLWSSSESLAFEQVQELKAQTDELKNFNTSLAIEIGEVVEKRLRENLSSSMEDALGPLKTVIESLAGNLGSMNQDALGDMADSFRDNLKQGAGREMEALVSSISEIKESLNGIIQGVNQTSNQFGERMSNAASMMETAFSAIGEQLHDQASGAASAFADHLRTASTEFGESVAPLSSQIEQFGKTVESLDEKLSSQREAFEDVANRVRDITNGAGKAIDELRASTSPLQNVAKNLAETSNSIESAGKSFVQTQEEMQNLSTNIQVSVNSIRESWEDYRQRFEAVDESLAGVIDKLMAGADSYRDNVQEFVTKLDQELNKAVGSLGSGVQGLTTAIEDLLEHQSDLVRSPIIENSEQPE